MNREQEGNQVFYTSLAVVFAIVIWGIISPTSFGGVANSIFDFLAGNFGWFYLTSMFSFVIFSIWIAFSKYGKIKLGKDDEEPEFSNLSWFAMLFSAGMGVGLVFWGVAEPLNHFVAPLGVEAGSQAAAEFAFEKSFFHWGLHPWANYAVLALGLAYMQFRKEKPGLISSVFIPLIGERGAQGPIGKLIDILAIFATVGGVATSLGMATLQITSGFNYMFGIPETNFSRVIVITIITILFIISAITGIEKGIKYLSNANVGLGAILMVLGLIVGPTVLIINNMITGTGSYLGSIVSESLRITGEDWYGWWTIFYWAWWIAWAPFVGTFVARISKGRTIREFVGGVLLAPTLASIAWFSIFGTLGIETGLEFGEQVVAAGEETALFMVMEHYPLGGVVSLVAVVLLTTFFITSADSATFVLGTMSSNGDLNPTTRRRVTWGLIQSGLALALMLAGGEEALGMLQTGSIAAAFPFAFIMLFCMVALVKALREDYKLNFEEESTKNS
ncbi:BCCT family transporter [Natroniella sulfidigena]|uniref:BCCT family transporter n=1 Tax=Natroniella sulfidigena TaxID=723921 RepID=UPI00200A2FCF|nr:BCCT family transporter [Natroniella sulfidigena]MCK8816730.1 BCCT family transporter [Natroniella sulfidigena]